MLPTIFVLSFVAVAHAQPPYAGAVNDIDSALHQLQDQILSMNSNLPNLTDSRRHYAILVTHVTRVASRLAQNCDENYEDIYVQELPASFGLGFMAVNEVISVADTSMKLLDKDTSKFQELFKSLCPQVLVDLDSSTEACNQLIDQAVRGDPERYSDEALITLTAGVVARELLDAELVPVANDHDEVDYLLNSINELQDLVSDLIDLIRLIERESRCV